MKKGREGRRGWRVRREGGKEGEKERIETHS